MINTGMIREDILRRMGEGIFFSGSTDMSSMTALLTPSFSATFLTMLATVLLSVSIWNRMGVKLCKSAPVVRVWEVQYT